MKLKLLVFLFLFISFNLFSAVTLRISDIETTVVLFNSYTNDYYVQKSITVKHKRDATSYFIGISGGAGSVDNRKLTKVSSGGYTDELFYQVIDNPTDNNILKNRAQATSLTDVLSGYFPQSKTAQYQTLTFYYIIPANQFVRSGTYTDLLLVKLFEGDLTTNSRKATKRVNLSVDEAVVADLSVVDRGGTFNSGSVSKIIDFGILEGGDIGNCDIISRTNADGGFSIAINSDNFGNLVHTFDNTQLIPYELLVNTVAADLTLGFSEINASQAEPLIPEFRYELDFLVVDPLPEVSSGDYRDVLTITLTALF